MNYPYGNTCTFQPISLVGGLQAFINTEDYIVISALSWYVNGGGYAATGHSARLMHHIVLDVNDFTHYEVHHINGNKLDNCRWNLQLVTFAQHQFTRPKQSNNTSGFKGVYWKKPSGNRLGRWVAQIGDGKARIHIGRFKTAEEAAHAYDTRAFEMYGKIAYLNFPK